MEEWEALTLNWQRQVEFWLLVWKRIQTLKKYPIRYQVAVTRFTKALMPIVHQYLVRFKGLSYKDSKQEGYKYTVRKYKPDGGVSIDTHKVPENLIHPSLDSQRGHLQKGSINLYRISGNTQVLEFSRETGNEGDVNSLKLEHLDLLKAFESMLPRRVYFLHD